MELNLIVPAPNGMKKQVGDGLEEINGKLWQVTGPHNIKDLENLKFYCVSYVWGTGTEDEGSFFNCKRKISDQTRPALAAAMKAAAVIQDRPESPNVEAFWVDAICIPQEEDSKERSKTLESMGFIYSTAISVIIVLQQFTWEIIESVSSEVSPRALSHEEMKILERDDWISRVWTYQELVNSRNAWFTALESTAQRNAIHAEKFFNCVGFSLDQWKKTSGKGHIAALEQFHNLDTLEETLVDRQMGDYLERIALGVLSNMSSRKFDPKYPKNRLLACMGALTQDVSWGPATTTLSAIAEKLMSICESNGDYSFIYTSDLRDQRPGMRWRPSPLELGSDETIILNPVANWHSWGTQTGHRDARGFWLDKMVLLGPAEAIDEEVEKLLERFLYGSKDLLQPNKTTGGIFRREECQDEELCKVVLKFLRTIGFKGDPEPQVCKTGLFFSQSSLKGRDAVEIYAASGIRWMFGNPGLARWKDGGETMYCAGVFTGAVKTELAKSLLME